MMPSLMQNRIDSRFATLKANNQGALVTYITAGDPNLQATHDLALAFDKAGVDVLEFGVPFSDPLADGIVNQMSAQRALEAGTTPEGVLQMVRNIRKSSEIPIVLYTYLNPMYCYGYEKFHKDAAAAGVDGLLILDLPPDEAERNADLAQASGLAHIQLIAPTTPDSRIPKIVRHGSGFIYYVSREGVTGERETIADSVENRVATIKSQTSLPVVVGFGISSPEHVAQIVKISDGAVVGSAIVKRIQKTAENPALNLAEEIAGFVAPLANAAHGA